jgi:hypothetical protein
MAMLNYFFATLLKHHGLLAIYAQDGHPDPEPIKLDPVGTALTLTIICIYIIVSGLVNDSCTSHRRSRADYEIQLAYTILEVVAILVMVENVRTPFVVGEADEPLLAAENPDPRWGLAPTSGPVTSGIRKTLTYLRAEAGILSMFRGLGYYIIYAFSEGFLNGLFVALLRPLLWVFADILVPVPIALLVWALNNAWLHKVISKPSQKNWVARVGEQKRTHSVLRAISLWALCRSASTFVTQTLTTIFVLSKFTVVDDKIHFADDASPRNTFLEAIGIYALNSLLLLLFVVPATIVLVRVQASSLPENDEAIVPFDKTFGGKVDSTSGDGRNQLTLFDAWRSFKWPSRIRLLKTYAKYFMLQVTLGLLSAGVLFTLVSAFILVKDGKV